MKVTKNLKKLNLLFVDDDALVNKSFSLIFKKYFKNIYKAYNGEEGLEIFKNNHIDIVISDIQMPIMNGIEMAKEIKKINEEIPIIFMTAFDESKYLKEAIEIGVEAYILKPIDKEILIKKLNKIGDNLVLQQNLKNYMEIMRIIFDYEPNVLFLLDGEYNVVFSNKIADETLKKNKECFEFIKTEIDKTLKENNFNELEIKIPNVYDEKYYKFKLIKVDEYILVNCVDVTDYKEKIEEIEDSSLKDELTGAYNRKKVDKIIDDLSDKYLSIIMCDIDNFKKINDTYGHLKGDEVLKKLSSVMQNNLRDDDLFIRWGGEEFVILLISTSIDKAEKIAEKLRKIVSEIQIKEVGHISCSFGIAGKLINNKNDFEYVLKKADDALYLAKGNGKNRVEVSH
jgi:two-component system cell cycle response regulator